MEGDMTPKSNGGNTVIWIVIAIAIVGIGVFLWWKNKNAPKSKTDPNTPETPNNPASKNTDTKTEVGNTVTTNPKNHGHTATNATVSTDGILQIGSKGDAVVKLQKMLRDKGALDHNGNPLGTDGLFGKDTKAAVLKYGMTYPVTDNSYKSVSNQILDNDAAGAKKAIGGLGKIVDGVADFVVAPIETAWENTKAIGHKIFS